MGKRRRKSHAGSKGGKPKSRQRIQRATRESSVAALEKLAIALNGCEKENLVIKCQQGIIFSDRGYVLPIGDKWVVRTLQQL